MNKIILAMAFLGLMTMQQILSAQQHNTRVFHFGAHKTYFTEGSNNFQLFFPNHENWAKDQSSGLSKEPFLSQQGINGDLTWTHKGLTYSAEVRFAWTNFNFEGIADEVVKQNKRHQYFNQRSFAQRFHFGYQIQQLFKKRKVNRQTIVRPGVSRAWHQKLIIEPRLIVGLLNANYDAQFAEVEGDQAVMHAYSGLHNTIQGGLEFRTGYQFAKKISLVAAAGYQQADFRYDPFKKFRDQSLNGYGSGNPRQDSFDARTNQSGYYGELLVGVQF